MSGQLVQGSRSTSKGKRKELCATVPVDHGNLPFENNENLWGMVESLEAFDYQENFKLAPREDIKNDLSLLDKLETHGFDVMKLREILTRILLLKDQQEDVENSLKESKMRLTGFDLVKCKAKEDGIKREDEMMRLTEEARLAGFRDKEIDADIASDQWELRMIEDELTRVNMEFEELVASPLF
ncbi:hypothetical protein POM88_008591 [Heracleum sosnowskyi]|uniref:Uncharacterized protein n=1 Tax=Heracleum sosnowskyi TaxID=360622 RepID=A0AAD8J901_9APIA|nr:hypothetical protein POM88_008591 [Heracleum sosnowskyi]